MCTCQCLYVMHTCTSWPSPYSYPLAVYSRRFVLTIVLDNEVIPRLVFVCGAAHCRTSATKHGCATTLRSMPLNSHTENVWHDHCQGVVLLTETLDLVREGDSVLIYNCYYLLSVWQTLVILHHYCVVAIRCLVVMGHVHSVVLWMQQIVRHKAPSTILVQPLSSQRESTCTCLLTTELKERGYWRKRTTTGTWTRSLRSNAEFQPRDLATILCLQSL